MILYMSQVLIRVYRLDYEVWDLADPVEVFDWVADYYCR